MRKFDYKKALELRKKGLTLIEIAHKLNVGSRQAIDYAIRVATKEELGIIDNQMNSEITKDKKLKKEITKTDVIEDSSLSTIKTRLSIITKKYKIALDEISILQDREQMWDSIAVSTPHTFKIDYSGPKKDTSAVANAVISDWHVDEYVNPATVNGLNAYDPQIAASRSKSFFKGVLKLIEINRTGVRIDKLFLSILGDVISGYLHEGDEENNTMSPIEGIMLAQDLIVSGINFLLKNGKFKTIDVLALIGNHARTGQKERHATGYKNSYEWLLYNHLADLYKNDSRINFIIPISKYYYADIMGYKFRFHHGHTIKYHGGIGGLTIPANKSIGQWNKAIPAYYDIFGHFHTYMDGGNFLCNGSLIGYNNFAQDNKFSFEEPKQAFFLVDKRGKTCTWPIYVEQK